MESADCTVSLSFVLAFYSAAVHPEYYKPSGRVPAITALVLVGSFVPAMLGALVYAWVGARAHWSLAVFTVWAFAGWLACIVRTACRLAKVRRPSLMKECGVVVALLAWVGQWIFWIVFVSYPDLHSMPGGSMMTPLADLLAYPRALFDGFGIALEASEWGDDPDEALLRSVGWLGEIAILVLVASAAGRKRAGQPFCEVANCWAKRVRLPCRFAAEQVMRSRAKLIANPDQLVAAMAPATVGRYRYAMVTLYSIKRQTFLSIDLVDTLSNGRRRIRRKQNRIQYLRISSRVAEGFLACAGQTARIRNSAAGRLHAKDRVLNWLEAQFD